MKKNQYYRAAWFLERKGLINFNNKINTHSLKDFCTAVDLYKKSSQENLTVDFSRVSRAFPSGMLPIIITLDQLRENGHSLYVHLPTDDNVRRLFRSVNWAHFLSPNQFEKSESTHDKHLVTRKFDDASLQKAVVDDFMDVVLRSMDVPRDIISGLEWSINEITDNVLNHSNSKNGGIIQASTFPKNQTIAFAVADGGRGILNSMNEGFPDLRTDIQAIGEAIKAGVTRNPKFGQGNGLAGTLKVTTMTGGSFDITSGRGRLVVTEEETKRKNMGKANYQGTVVCGGIRIASSFSVTKALDFGKGTTYPPLDIIETHYEMEDEDCLFLKMKEETTGFGSRRSGIQIRTKIFNLLNAEPKYALVIDWEGVPVISSSFADEVFGKMFLKLGAITFSSRIRNKGMEPFIIHLLDKAIAQRLAQEVDPE